MTYNQQGGPKPGGYLYLNEKKQRAEQPDQKGKIRIGEDIVGRIMAGEREFYISAWNKQDQKGQRFQSVNLKQIEARAPGGGYGGAPQQAAWGGAPPPAPAYAPQPTQPYGVHHSVSTPAQYPAPQGPRPGGPGGPHQPPYGTPAPGYHAGGMGHAVPGAPPYGSAPQGYGGSGPVMNDEIPFN